MKGAAIGGLLAATVLSTLATAQFGSLPRQAPGNPEPGPALAFGTPLLIPGTRHFASLARLGDFDLDGVQDFAFGGGFLLDPGGPLSTFLLDPGFRLRKTEVLANPSSNPTHTFPYVCTGDLDRDGITDILAIGQHGGIAIARPLGARHADAALSRFAVSHRVPRELDPGGRMAVRLVPRVHLLEDVNGDGIPDFLFSGDFEDFAGRVGTTGLLLFPGDGEGGFRDPQNLVTGRVLTAAVGDLDGDRRPDVAALDDQHQLHWLLQRKRGVLDPFRLQVTDLVAPERLHLIDLDRDGCKDYVLIEGLKAGQIQLALLHNRGDGGVDQRRRRTPGVRDVRSVVDADLDQDGYADLALLQPDTGEGMTLFVLRSNGQGEFEAPFAIQVPFYLATELTVGSYEQLAAGDVDGDGALDLWIAPARAQSEGPIGVVVVPNLGPRRPELLRLGTASEAASGRVPAIAVTGPVQVGNTAFHVHLSRAPESSPAWLFLSPKRLDVELYGMRFKVFPFLAFGATTVSTGSLGGIAGIRLQIPDDPTLVGQSLFLQWVLPSPGAPNPLGLARSEAIELRIAERR